MKPKISIIDYGMGNIFSIKCALDAQGLDSVFTDNIQDIRRTDGIILPGVGAFPEAIRRLKKNKIPDVIEEFHKKNKIIIGVCLGMQLLFEKSFEFSENSGLSLINGKVIKFEKDFMNVGWRQINLKSRNKPENTLLKNNLNSKHMYFIHSYHAIPEDKSYVTSTAKFEKEEFVSSINQKNLFAFQFHPEKSGLNSMKIYEEIKRKLI